MPAAPQQFLRSTLTDRPLMADPVERWRRVEQICQAALDLSGAERAALVQQASGTDEELRREVERLLAQQSAANGFLDDSVNAVAARHIWTDHTLTGQTVNSLGPGLTFQLARSSGVARDQP